MSSSWASTFSGLRPSASSRVIQALFKNELAIPHASDTPYLFGDVSELAIPL